MKLAMDLRGKSRSLSVFFVAMISMTALTGCSDDSNTTNVQDSTENDMNNPMASVEATVVQWQDQVQLTYTLTNTSDTDLVAFDIGFGSQNGVGEDLTLVELDDDWGVRLFKGNFVSNVDIPSITPVTIGGRLVTPNETLHGIATVAFPFSVTDDPDATEAEKNYAEEASFCIGFSPASEFPESIVESGVYDLSAGLELQQFACTRVARP